MKEYTRTTRRIVAMMASGEYEPPDPYDNLPEGIEFATEIARKDPWCPPEMRKRLIKWIGDANKMLEQIRATQQASEDQEK